MLYIWSFDQIWHLHKFDIYTYIFRWCLPCWTTFSWCSPSWTTALQAFSTGRSQKLASCECSPHFTCCPRFLIFLVFLGFLVFLVLHVLNNSLAILFQWPFSTMSHKLFQDDAIELYWTELNFWGLFLHNLPFVLHLFLIPIKPIYCWIMKDVVILKNHGSFVNSKLFQTQLRNNIIISFKSFSNFSIFSIFSPQSLLDC